MAREDPGSRLQDRRGDILSAWDSSPRAQACRFVIRPHLDLLIEQHVRWLRETCAAEDITVLVLDTWTALSPGADPLGAKDQATLAAVMVQLAQDIGGVVVVLDHSRKNRPEGQSLSAADIFGPLQKWAAAEHVLMLDETSDAQRTEVFIEGKDGETYRFFLDVSPRGSGDEKFTYAGSVQEIAESQRQKGDENREAVFNAVARAGARVSADEVVSALAATGRKLVKDTVQRHLTALVEAGRLARTGKTKNTRYEVADSGQQPSSENHVRESATLYE